VGSRGEVGRLSDDLEPRVSRDALGGETRYDDSLCSTVREKPLLPILSIDTEHSIGVASIRLPVS
jgi:hypothetical protein